MLGYPGISYNTTVLTPLIVVRRVSQGVVDDLHPELLGSLSINYSSCSTMNSLPSSLIILRRGTHHAP